jgi:enoyl-CoA hydratase/carnithine racemase
MNLLGFGDFLLLRDEPNIADVTESPCVLVDLQSSPVPETGELSAMAAWATRQPLPLVALSHAPLSSELCGLFDVVVPDLQALERISSAVHDNPRAAAVLVQVLRAGECLDIPSALAVESLGYATLLGGVEFARWLNARDPRHNQPKVMTRQAVALSRADDRLEIVLSHPENRNALSAAMRDGLSEAFRLVLMDHSITQVLVRGEGPIFCAGGDLGEFGMQRDLAEGHFIRSARMPAQYLAACRERVSVQVQGACIGAGIELSAFAATITAAKGTFFRLPEVAMGLIPGAGGCVSIPRRIGRQRAAFMALSGRDVDTEQALEWGLIDAIR